MFLTAKKNKEISSDEKESEGNDENNDSDEVLESSYELFTPIKTRLAKSVGRLGGSPRATHTRSGRKIKRIQYLEYESEFNNLDDQKSLPNKSKDQTSEKNSALKELNTLKNEFNDLRISSSKISTPTTRSKVARMNETPVKGGVTPRGKIISPEIIYSRSGRKIKKVQYSEVLDSVSSGVDLRKGSLKLQNSLKKDNVSSEEFVTPTKKRLMQHSDESSNTPKSKNALFPMQTKSGSKLKNVQHIDEIEKPKENEVLEICSQESALKKKGALSERNNEISILETTFTPSKNGAKGKTVAKLRKIPKENASPNSIYTKSGRKVKKKHYSEDSYQETESSNEEVSKDIIKPTALYDDDNAVGKQIFGFQTPKHRNAMLEKASRSANKLNNIQKTPKSNKTDKINELKTPYNMRKRLKKGIVKEVSRQSIDAFLEDSGSDYVPSSSCSDVSEEEEEEDDYEKESGESSDGYEISGVIPLEKAIETEKMIKRKRRAAINNFIFTSEDYFENKNIRSLTSNHTLSQLKTPRFNQGQLSEILKSVGSKHEKSINELNLENEAMFTRWLLSMNEGFNVLVYGVGSKKKLLNAFHRQFLSRCYVAVVNGYFPGLVLKDILDCITNDVLRLRRSVPSQSHDIVDFIGTKLRNRNNRLFLLVHNIDGASLRCDKIQLVLAHLAADPNIHLVATLDHINSPLLWDQNKLSLFNFTWEDGTSFLPYTNETSYESSLMVQQSGGIALAGLKNIFKSLNTNSRRIFKLLLEHQLEDKSSKSQGMLFSELYRESRNSFLVSSDLALRTQLTEFFDHQLVKWKKDSEHLVIPLDITILKQFQNYLNSENAV